MTFFPHKQLYNCFKIKIKEGSEKMAGSDAKYSIINSKDAMTVSIFGEIDHHSAKGIRTAIDEEMFRITPKRLLLNLAGVNFMDSSGLGLILGRMSKAEEIGCRVVISDASESVFKMLDLAGIGRLITIECKKTDENVKKTQPEKRNKDEKENLELR